MDIDSLCNNMNNVTVEEAVNPKLIKDIDLIIKEIIKGDTFDRDIYDICVNCGHDLTWDQEYIIYQTDIKWLKKHGMYYFFSNVNIKKPINSYDDYHKVWYLFKELYELFSIQVTHE